MEILYWVSLVVCLFYVFAYISQTKMYLKESVLSVIWIVVSIIPVINTLFMLVLFGLTFYVWKKGY